MTAIGTCEILLPMRYCSLWDIASYEILLPMRYCSLWDIAPWKVLLPAKYCSLRDIATCKILLPARNGYLRDIASDAIWLPVRYACLQNISYTRMPFQVICNMDSQRDMTAYGYQPPIQLYCQIVRYTKNYWLDIATSEITGIGTCEIYVPAIYSL